MKKILLYPMRWFYSFSLHEKRLLCKMSGPSTEGQKRFDEQKEAKKKALEHRIESVDSFENVLRVISEKQDESTWNGLIMEVFKRFAMSDAEIFDGELQSLKKELNQWVEDMKLGSSAAERVRNIVREFDAPETLYSVAVQLGLFNEEEQAQYQEKVDEWARKGDIEWVETQPGVEHAREYLGKNPVTGKEQWVWTARTRVNNRKVAESVQGAPPRIGSDQYYYKYDRNGKRTLRSFAERQSIKKDRQKWNRESDRILKKGLHETKKYYEKKCKRHTDIYAKLSSAEKQVFNSGSRATLDYAEKNEVKDRLKKGKIVDLENLRTMHSTDAFEYAKNFGQLRVNNHVSTPLSGAIAMHIGTELKKYFPNVSTLNETHGSTSERDMTIHHRDGSQTTIPKDDGVNWEVGSENARHRQYVYTGQFHIMLEKPKIPGLPIDGSLKEKYIFMVEFDPSTRNFIISTPLDDAFLDSKPISLRGKSLDEAVVAVKEKLQEAHKKRFEQRKEWFADELRIKANKPLKKGMHDYAESLTETSEDERNKMMNDVAVNLDDKTMTFLQGENWLEMEIGFAGSFFDGLELNPEKPFGILHNPALMEKAKNGNSFLMVHQKALMQFLVNEKNFSETNAEALLISIDKLFRGIQDSIKEARDSAEKYWLYEGNEEAQVSVEYDFKNSKLLISYSHDGIRLTNSSIQLGWNTLHKKVMPVGLTGVFKTAISIVETVDGKSIKVVPETIEEIFKEVPPPPVPEAMDDYLNNPEKSNISEDAQIFINYAHDYLGIRKDLLAYGLYSGIGQSDNNYLQGKYFKIPYARFLRQGAGDDIQKMPKLEQSIWNKAEEINKTLNINFDHADFVTMFDNIMSLLVLGREDGMTEIINALDDKGVNIAMPFETIDRYAIDIETDRSRLISVAREWKKEKSKTPKNEYTKRIQELWNDHTDRLEKEFSESQSMDVDGVDIIYLESAGLIPEFEQRVRNQLAGSFKNANVNKIRVRKPRDPFGSLSGSTSWTLDIAKRQTSYVSGVMSSVKKQIQESKSKGRLPIVVLGLHGKKDGISFDGEQFSLDDIRRRCDPDMAAPWIVQSCHGGEHMQSLLKSGSNEYLKNVMTSVNTTVDPISQNFAIEHIIEKGMQRNYAGGRLADMNGDGTVTFAELQYWVDTNASLLDPVLIDKDGKLISRYEESEKDIQFGFDDEEPLMAA